MGIDIRLFFVLCHSTNFPRYKKLSLSIPIFFRPSWCPLFPLEVLVDGELVPARRVERVHDTSLLVLTHALLEEVGLTLQ